MQRLGTVACGEGSLVPGTRWLAAAAVLAAAVPGAAVLAPAAIAGPATRAGHPVIRELDAVSCPSARLCMAIGSTWPASTVVLRWNGRRWATLAAPRPPAGILSAIWCGSATSCLAVGAASSSALGRTRVPLAERWDGRTWTALPVPSPAHTVQSWLADIDCTSPTACTAVGYYTTAKGGNNPPTYALAEGWNGQGWRLEQAVNPAPKATMLGSVSCSSGTACTAVGTSSAPNTTVALVAERWNGTAWAAQGTEPSGGGGPGDLNAVSCPAATNCTAVGDSGGDDNQGLSEIWNGKNWGAQSVVAPSDWSTLTDVTCFSAMDCLAVGSDDGQRGDVTLAARWNGKSWSVLRTPNVPRPALNSTLGAISCASPSACMAVGGSDRGVGKTDYLTHERALAEWWNGAKWRMLPTPVRPPRPWHRPSSSCAGPGAHARR